MRKILSLLVLALLSSLLLGAKSDPSCDSNGTPVSTSGVHKDTILVQTNPAGRTVEQENVRDRLKADNQPGSIKHLYVISAYSGQVILYSTVRGKVTSGGKRLSPSTVAVNHESYPDCITVDIGGRNYCTTEVLGDDGAYGSSGDYLFWFDSKGDAFHGSWEPTRGAALRSVYAAAHIACMRAIDYLKGLPAE